MDRNVRPASFKTLTHTRQWLRGLATHRGRDELTETGNETLTGDIVHGWGHVPVSDDRPELGPA